jgi:hypothetical protein
MELLGCSGKEATGGRVEKLILGAAGQQQCKPVLHNTAEDLFTYPRYQATSSYTSPYITDIMLEKLVKVAFLYN